MRSLLPDMSEWRARIRSLLSGRELCWGGGVLAGAVLLASASLWMHAWLARHAAWDEKRRRHEELLGRRFDEQALRERLHALEAEAGIATVGVSPDQGNISRANRALRIEQSVRERITTQSASLRELRWLPLAGTGREGKPDTERLLSIQGTVTSEALPLLLHRLEFEAPYLVFQRFTLKRVGPPEAWSFEGVAHAVSSGEGNGFP